MMEDHEKTSMFYWWGKVKDLDIPVPKTIMIRWTGTTSSLFDLVDGNLSGDASLFISEVARAIDEMGCPAFIRGDETSNKHNWNLSCYIENREKIVPNVGNIVEFSLMTDIGFRGVAVREFLDLDWKFKSHHGMPVAAERRYFVKDGNVECWHPYWPPASIRRPTTEKWRELLKELQTPSGNEIEILTRHAERVGKTIGGYWSIDFCRHRDGTWYLTDMAPGILSYHWATCPNSPPDMLHYYGDPEKIPGCMD